MSPISTVGLDLAKSVFQVHAIDQDARVIDRRTIRRSQLLQYFENLPSCLVGMEGCGGAHHWARELTKLGHTVKIMPASYVKAYVKRNKTDAADAEAICEAVTRPTMRFIPIKSAQEQSLNMVLKTRELLIRQRTQAVNALRGHMTELGIVANAGFKASAKLIAIIRDIDDMRIPSVARYALSEIADQIEILSSRIATLERGIVVAVKNDDLARRLTSIPGVGPITAATVRALVPDASAFKTGRDFSAWIGLTPRSHSSGGKQKLGAISKMGNPHLRSLMMVGAMAILKMAHHGARMTPWVAALLQRRPFKVVAVAMANKIARVIWALMTKGGVYQTNPIG